ncbi:hypothetical protein DFH06DRAFT_1255635 [Mycena polygramma]|nr:hypothetical protein DFH06DRAFT_1255635 [Mycena polygramma]
MSVLLWSSPQDAGFISTYADSQYISSCHSDDKATATEAMSGSIPAWSTRDCPLTCTFQAAEAGEKQCVEPPKAGMHPRYRNAKRKMAWTVIDSRHGQAQVVNGQVVAVEVSWRVASLYSCEGIHHTGKPTSVRLLRPTAKTASDTPSDNTMHFTVSRTGRSLIHADSAADLCMALIHALLGYLSLCQSGFMHGDIGIWNVILAEDESRPRSKSTRARAFGIKGSIIDAQRPKLDHMDPEESPPIDVADEIKALVAKLQIGTEGKAFIAGGDTAIEWSEYLAKGHNRKTGLGDRRFMALQLQKSMRGNTAYLQSPIDDLESF